MAKITFYHSGVFSCEIKGYNKDYCFTSQASRRVVNKRIELTPALEFEEAFHMKFRWWLGFEGESRKEKEV